MSKNCGKLILLRHGQSMWNEKNLFTGWVDVPLSQKGVEEAELAGKQLSHVPIDKIFVSSLIRSKMTAMLVMALHKSGKVPVEWHVGERRLEEWGQVYSLETRQNCIPVVSSWELNERMYGKLQGLNKKETADKYGEDQVKLWRRSYDVAPPEGESLQMTAQRSIPYFEKEILPCLKEGMSVFVCAHGNSLRSIIMHIEQLSKEQILQFELETGKPRCYSYQNGKFAFEAIC